MNVNHHSQWVQRTLRTYSVACLCLVASHLTVAVGADEKLEKSPSKTKPSPVVSKEKDRYADFAKLQEQDPTLQKIARGVTIPDSIKDQMLRTDYFKASSPAYVRELGEKELHKVEHSKKILFFFGHYLDEPYVISRKGTGLYINNLLVESYRRFPPGYEEGDPPVPADLRADTRLTDLKFGKAGIPWISAKLRWQLWNRPRDEALAAFFAEMRQLPCVKSVEFVDAPKPPPDTNFTFLDDRPRKYFEIVCHSPDCRQTISVYTDQDYRLRGIDHIIELLERNGRSYSRMLNQPGCFFAGPGALGLIDSNGHPDARHLFFPRIVTILKSRQPEDEKLRQIYHYFSFGEKLNLNDRYNVDNIRMMIRTFRGSPQLDPKLKLIDQERAAKGIETAEDIWNRNK